MSSSWILFLPQLPSSPSSLRVFVWRRLRAAGALSLQNGVWVFPEQPEHQRFLTDLLAEVQPQGGQGFVFVAASLEDTVDMEITRRFQADRGEEYAELAEQGSRLLQEIEQETAARKFTFAELEENEYNLQRLESWLHKIQARDFFQGDHSETAVEVFARCQEALNTFTQAVYANEGLGEPKENGTL